HKKLRNKCRWYDIWHERPGFSLYHWMVLTSFAIFIFFLAIFQFKAWQKETGELQAKLPSPNPSFSLGGVLPGEANEILIHFAPGVAKQERQEILRGHHLEIVKDLEPIDVEV